MVAKAEQIEGKEIPRYLLTSLGKKAWPCVELYEELYCARGEMENRIKEQLSLFSDRLSTEMLRANRCGCPFLRSHTCCWKRCGGWAWRVQSGRKPKLTPSGSDC